MIPLITLFVFILLVLHIRYVKTLAITFKDHPEHYAYFYVRGLVQRRVKIVQTLNPSEPSQLIFYNIENAHKYYLELIFKYHMKNIEEVLDAKDNSH